MPRRKRQNGNSDTDNEMSGNESEISNSSRDNLVIVRESSEDERESDDSSDMDLEECESRRSELLKDCQDLENQFIVLREQLYRERMQEVESQIASLKAGTSLQYLSKLKQLEDERRIRIEVAGILREVQLQNLSNQYDAGKQSAQQNYDNDKRLTHDDIYNELMETIRQLEEDRRNSEIAWGEGGKYGIRKRTSSRSKKAVTVSGPYIVYMLKPEEIMEDWTEIMKACQNN